MIGLDTNILLRLFIEDDPTQTACARTAVRSAVEMGRAVFVNLVVLVEFIWVMESVFRKQRSEIAVFLEALVENSALTVESEQHIRKVIPLYRDRGFDFADLLIGEINRETGCSATYTFDRKAARLAHFQLLT
jgi:predicted nucleic-acid-binding protein